MLLFLLRFFLRRRSQTFCFIAIENLQDNRAAAGGKRSANRFPSAPLDFGRFFPSILIDRFPFAWSEFQSAPWTIASQVGWKPHSGDEAIDGFGSSRLQINERVGVEEREEG